MRDSTQPVGIRSHNVRVPGFTAVDSISIFSLPLNTLLVLEEGRGGDDTWEVCRKKGSGRGGECIILHH